MFGVRAPCITGTTGKVISKRLLGEVEPRLARPVRARGSEPPPVIIDMGVRANR